MWLFSIKYQHKQQYTRIKQRQPKGKWNFKEKFLTTNQTNIVRVEANLHVFSMEKKNDLTNNPQGNKLMTSRSNKLTKY